MFYQCAKPARREYVLNINDTMEHHASVKNGVGRLVFAGIAILFEIAFMLGVMLRLNSNAEWVSLLTRVVSLMVVLALYSQDKTASVKMPWIILMLIAPVLGLSLFLMIGLSGSTRAMRRRYEKVDKELLPKLFQGPEEEENLIRKDKPLANIAVYLQEQAGYPVYQNTDVVYYNDAAKALEAQKQALRTAKKFIFMEYHAIEDAEAFHGIEEILAQKAREGVEVRLFYDDIGSIFFINKDFVTRMEALGIRCRVFNPMGPFLNVFLNNRDHRKITVIDGEIAFTGGYNLANEYFNLTSPYGHWKDTGIRMTGEAVRSMTVTFLEMWNAVRDKDIDDKDYNRFLPHSTYVAQENGFVLPYADNPMDRKNIGEDVYISLIEQAQDYIYFMTPYLIITDEMKHAMCLASKRGVDVRIITPGIPDKRTVYSITRSYYHNLVTSGIRIFEYTPGFCHAKMCVCDDRVATCGTINLDYRSLYHHFENGCMMMYNRAVMDIRRDFERTFPQCREVTEEYRDGKAAPMRFGQLVLRLFSAMM